MGRLRKLSAMFVSLCLLLAGCGSKPAEDVPEEISVYATFYPIYAAAAMVAENVPDLRLSCLVQPQDGCLRSYVLSDWDAALLGSADAVLMGGQGLESFEGALLLAGEEEEFAVAGALYNMELINLPAENSDADSDSHWLDANPHIYMSIDGMIGIVGRIAQSMILLDPRYEIIYLENLEHAEQQLEALKDEVRTQVGDFAGRKVAVLNEALVYFAQDCGLEIALCWDRDSGESMGEAEMEALLAAMEERGIQVVLIEKQAPQGLAEELEEAGIAVARLDVLSTRRAEEGYEGYFAAQRENAAAVRAAYLSIPEVNE